MSQINSEIFRRGCSLTKPATAPLQKPLKRMRSLAILMTACLLAFTAGCALTQETKRSLTTYIQAMDEVQESANLFLTDYANTVEVRKQLESGGGAQESNSKPEYPANFVLTQNPSLPTTKVEKKIEESRDALEVIRQYNDALVALAEGRPEAEIKNQVNQFGGALQTLTSIGGLAVPGIEQFTDIAAKIIKLAQDAYNREQFKQAVQEGEEPVNVILTALENQTPAIYKASVVIAQRGQDVPMENIRQVGFALSPFLAKYSPPTDPAIHGELGNFQAELVAIGTRTKTLPALPNPFPFQSGKPEYDKAAHDNMKIFMQVVRANDAQYKEIVAKQNAYYKLMEKYVALLRQTRRSLKVLADSLDAPIDIQREAHRLIIVAFELRNALADFRNPSVAASSI